MFSDLTSAVLTFKMYPVLSVTLLTGVSSLKIILIIAFHELIGISNLTVEIFGRSPIGP